MDRKKKLNTELLLFKKYNLIKNIGGGAFGTVFLGTNAWTNEKVAIKVEERKNARATLEREAYILYYLKGPGLPELKSFGKTKKYNILIQTLLGKSLYDIFNECNKEFTIKDVCMIGIQILERLEYIHSKNYIHRDIKPHNFLIGIKNEGLIYIIDFGLSKKYKSSRGKHVKFSVSKHITGTPRFCSVNAMRGVEQSRRDDLESLCYLIIYFFKGFLPWQGIKLASKYQRFNAIAKMKKYIKVESLCEGLPEEIISFCKYTKKLEFAENPNYEYMKNLFFSVLNKNGLKNDNKFSWIKKRNGGKINNDTKMNNYSSHKNSPYKRLYQKIQISLEKKRKEIKEKERNNEYTLNTIYIENKNIISNVSDLNNIQNKPYIQSNDINVLNNNLYQLNIDNYKHSYNYPLVIYSNKLTENNEQNKKFNKIAKSFKDEDDIIEEKQINIPDKISIIDATKSNLTNFQISNNKFLIIPENKNSLNKGMKLHDYIRQEEKEGGVIGKDYDFKENEYFKINTPLFISEKENLKKVSNNNIKNKDILTNSNNKQNIKLIDDNKNKSKSIKNEDINININKEKINIKKQNTLSYLNNNINIVNINNEDKNNSAFFVEKDKLKQINKNNTMNGNIKNNAINDNIRNNGMNDNIRNNTMNDNIKNSAMNDNIKNNTKLDPFFIKHTNINLNNEKNIKPELKVKYISKTDTKQNSIKFEKKNQPINLFSTSPLNNNIHNNHILNNKKKIDKNINIINNNNNTMINSNNKKQNELNHYIKIDNNKKISKNIKKVNNKNNNNKLKIDVNDIIGNKIMFSNNNKSNQNIVSTNLLKEIKEKNNEKMINRYPNGNKVNNRNQKLLNTIGYNVSPYSYNSNINKNKYITTSFSNNSNNNQTNQDNIINQKLINSKKKNNNIIINNVIIKNNCNNLLYNSNKDKNSQNYNKLNVNQKNILKSIKINNSNNVYRPLSIRYSNSSNINNFIKNPFKDTRLSLNNNTYKNNLSIPD